MFEKKPKHLFEKIPNICSKTGVRCYHLSDLGRHGHWGERGTYACHPAKKTDEEVSQNFTSLLTFRVNFVNILRATFLPIDLDDADISKVQRTA